MSYDYSYSTDFSDLSDIGSAFGIGFAAIAGIAVIVIVIAIVIAIALYIIKAIPIYILSKKAGRNYPWLAFIPIIGQSYTLATIGEGPVTIPLIKKTIANRGTAFWILFGISIGVSAVSSILSACAIIPVIGILTTLLATLLSVALAVVSGLFYYAFYYDIFVLYQPESTNNKAFAVLCALSPYFCADILSTIFLYTLIKKEPVHAPMEETIIVS